MEVAVALWLNLVCTDFFNLAPCPRFSPQCMSSSNHGSRNVTFLWLFLNLGKASHSGLSSLLASNLHHKWIFFWPQVLKQNTSIYFWFSMLLQAVNALFLASSSDNNFVGVEIARDFGRIFEAIKGEVLGCSVRTGVLKAGNLSLKISSQYLIRYSVTTAWTPTPRTRGDKGIVESLQEHLYEGPEWVAIRN